MCYVDPSFDTYSLDSCARYGVLTQDPCLYLKGTPSPYLQDFYPHYNHNLYNDIYGYGNKKTNWKKIISSALALTAATVLLVKGRGVIKKITPDNIKKFFSDKTPNFIKSCGKRVVNAVETSCKWIGKKFSYLSK